MIARYNDRITRILIRCNFQIHLTGLLQINYDVFPLRNFYGIRRVSTTPDRDFFDNVTHNGGLHFKSPRNFRIQPPGLHSSSCLMRFKVFRGKTLFVLTGLVLILDKVFPEKPRNRSFTARSKPLDGQPLNYSRCNILALIGGYGAYLADLTIS